MKRKAMLAALLVLILVPGGLVAYTYMKSYAPPDNAAEHFLTRKAHAHGNTRVVCAGDSLTHGRVSFDYTRILEDKLGDGFTVINAGINDELAYNLYMRLDDIIACDPDYVTVFIGTNDVRAVLDPGKQAEVQKKMGLPRPPGHLFFEECLVNIIRQLKDRTRARVAVFSLPMIGEDPSHAYNGRIREFNATIKRISVQEDVAFLPFHYKMAEMVRAKPYVQKITTEQIEKQVLYASFKHFLFHKSFEDISSDNGFLIMTDGIHMNGIGAGLAADLIRKFIFTFS